MRNDALEVLARMNRELLSDERVETSLQRVADAALVALGADHASVRLCESDGVMATGARAGLGTDRPPPPFKRGEGVLGWVAERGELARIDDTRREPRFIARDRGFEVGSLLSVPIAGSDGTMGVLSVSSCRPRAFAEADEAVAQLLASAAAQSLRTAELQQLAMTDSQTLAYNRRWLLPRLREEMEHARRQGEPLSLLLIDLDHFKRVNDEHGHPTGDAVLRAFADTVRDCVRGADVLFRRGGEEFVLIMPTTDEQQATTVAERLRGRLDRAPLTVRGNLLLVQTASIGVACWDGGESAEALEERADLAMYEAKRHGRNRVTVSRPSQLLPEQPSTMATRAR
jgi:diguanylate cyclase (GGDEF)-like protein